MLGKAKLKAEIMKLEYRVAELEDMTVAVLHGNDQRKYIGKGVSSMERLTERHGDTVRLKGRSLAEASTADIVKMAERLATYEDRELEPEEIDDLISVREITPETEYAINKHADSLIERLDALLKETDEDARARELMDADKSGILVFPEKYPEIWALFYFCVESGIKGTMERLYDGYAVHFPNGGDFAQHYGTYGGTEGSVEPAIGDDEFDYSAVGLNLAKTLVEKHKSKLQAEKTMEAMKDG